MYIIYKIYGAYGWSNKPQPLSLPSARFSHMLCTHKIEYGHFHEPNPPRTHTHAHVCAHTCQAGSRFAYIYLQI